MAESAAKGQWDAPSGEVRQITVPADARKLCTLAHVGYEDAFLVEVGDPGARTPEEWVRVIIESAPAAVRRALWPGWTAIGLKLHPTTDRESVLGWEVHRSTPEFVLLAAVPDRDARPAAPQTERARTSVLNLRAARQPGGSRGVGCH